MAIVRWDPFKDLSAIQDRINRLFDESLSRSKFFDKEGIASGFWSPAVDIYETESDIVLKAELPEIDQKDIHINIENNVLTLKGERKLEKETKEENYHRIERSYGSFSRSFNFPNAVEVEKIKAQYKDGVLKINMPKKAEKKTKKIDVEIK
ncbi:MAG: molecular chaperone [Candidatus Schekmanbacteria bacterium RIFCSPHIGHO2_02_FULL_38_11]|uniref:Molecular chaperone n=1 Tax=Candidatus Schekmanbacteria bacterium RIFCSPLOWO2_12_FULL_38_15 TaxID=1817883 RepID=A0A1F7SE67_9BACT|nr:MAG: molecular chaperone [Candidatus Schekmanbacteria bacterium GWA2_38_9]OGL49096.1 MAG: molecular chaperone [Candidatus Schekmanbacteria bacterium RIFCSPLOWO2_02_FULL_38_14]OGL49222.1 MAG: molecular chaperone [Candidatus Schekmanbacteria bacterium RIFCSPHIGHO2_02_FULL_38_11]OGL52072.1 MAG: molecular chaperone [Candidatus Schekmanbacteria bacterium RIFCSPLOWO2_12_FULL_38_15]